MRQELQRVHQELESQRERADALEGRLDEVGEPAKLLGDSFAAGYDRGFFLKSADSDFRLDIGGWIQPRYQHVRQSGVQDTSSFTMRRVRLDIRGHVIQPELTFRVMSEFARTANLRDAWVNYAFNPALQVRMGQFTVPFQWQRFIGPRRQHFAERGVPSETFGVAIGRDVGVMAHGRLLDDRLAYGAGFFDGAGRNVGVSNSDGNMASARLTLAVLGDIPREESDYAWSEEPQLSLGAGVQGAWRNERRNWALGQPETANQRADYATGTADARFAWQGFSVAADGYLRHVDPQHSAVGNYDGWAYMVTAGYFIVPKQVEAAARWSQLQWDRDSRDTRRDEWGIGLNFYHHGHDWKTRVNYLNDNPKDRRQSHTILVEHHLQF